MKHLFFLRSMVCGARIDGGSSGSSSIVRFCPSGWLDSSPLSSGTSMSSRARGSPYAYPNPQTRQQNRPLKEFFVFDLVRSKISVLGRYGRLGRQVSFGCRGRRFDVTDRTSERFDKRHSSGTNATYIISPHTYPQPGVTATLRGVECLNPAVQLNGKPPVDRKLRGRFVYFHL